MCPSSLYVWEGESEVEAREEGHQGINLYACSADSTDIMGLVYIPIVACTAVACIIHVHVHVHGLGPHLPM